jgi:hypothetical protein
VQRLSYLGLSAFFECFLTNREGAKGAKESVSFFFLRVLRVFAVHSFFPLLALFFEFFLTNREGAKSAKKEEEEGLR